MTEQNAVLTVCFTWQDFCGIFTKKIMGYYYGIGGEFYLIAIVFAAISMIVSQRLKSKFRTYSKIQLRNGLSGAEIAEKMLADHGIRDVKVVSVKGMLTDHYNPMKKTVNLSESVYSERNAAAAAVAAHECGHAVQHAQGYEWLKMRSVLVPMVSVHQIYQCGLLLLAWACLAEPKTIPLPA